MDSNTNILPQAVERPALVSGALFAEAAHSQMPLEKAMQLAEDFCKHEAWGLDFWREPMTVLAAEVARLRSANVEDYAHHREPLSPERWL